MAKTERQKAKEKAWSAFSKYIRLRDCIITTDTTYEGICVTCNRLYPFKQTQAGHFIPGRNNAVLFREDMVHLQCAGCNLNPPRGKGGNLIKYWPFMENTYGRERVDKMIAEAHQEVIYKIPDLKEIEAKYKQMFIDLTKDKSRALWV